MIVGLEAARHATMGFSGRTTFVSRLGRRITYPPGRWRWEPNEGSWKLEKPSLVYRLGESIEADAMILTLARFEARLGDLGARPVLPMFDGLLLEAPADTAAETAARIAALMASALIEVCPGVHAAVTVGGPWRSWQDEQPPGVTELVLRASSVEECLG
jgi:hypothetical protein